MSISAHKKKQLPLLDNILNSPRENSFSIVFSAQLFGIWLKACCWDTTTISFDKLSSEIYGDAHINYYTQ